MGIKTTLIENLDGSLTNVSKQDDKELKHIVDGNEKLKFDTRHHKYTGDSSFHHRVA